MLPPENFAYWVLPAVSAIFALAIGAGIAAALPPTEVYGSVSIGQQRWLDHRHHR